MHYYNNFNLLYNLCHVIYATKGDIGSNDKE